jgi:hypothetical protein
MTNKDRAYQFFMNYYDSEFNINVLENRFKDYVKDYQILSTLRNHIIANFRKKFLHG